MSDRPSAVNGKRNRAWGTTHGCQACGQCLCFSCHPAGPCVDEHVGDPPPSRQANAFLARPSTTPTAGSFAEAC